MLLKGISTTAKRRLKHVILLTLDVAAAAMALFIAAALQADFTYSLTIFSEMWTAVPITIVAAASIFFFTGVSRRVWRFFSITDLSVIILAAALTAVTSYVALNLAGAGMRLPISFLFMHWLLLVIGMCSLRLARRLAPRLKNSLRYDSQSHIAQQAPLALIAGSPDGIDMVLRQAGAGLSERFTPIGVLDETEIDLRRTIRGVPIRGGLEALNRVYNELSEKGKQPEKLIIAADASAVAESKYVDLAGRAKSLGLSVMSASSTSAVQDDAVSVRPFDLSELLGRPSANLDLSAIKRAVTGKRILVTGAGGSIGGELARQIASLEPEKLVLLDASEFNLYSIDHEIQSNFPNAEADPLLCDIRNRDAIMHAFEKYQFDIVFHAAALKHVPMVEKNPCAGVETNVIGTKNIADAAQKFNATAMVQVSTDKAVDPIGVMGATKRLGELYCQALDLAGAENNSNTRFMTVRFGNVLGSSGSVIPLFQHQLKQRMPLTVTHPDMTRFFMTIHEAVQLVLQSTQGALDNGTRRGRIFVLDMGEPIKILDIAKRMIRLSGLTPGKDVKIEIVGERPGEKLFEELFDSDEEQLPSEIDGVFEAEPSPVPLTRLNKAFAALSAAAAHNDAATVRKELFALLNKQNVAPEKIEVADTRKKYIKTEKAGAPIAPANDELRLGA